MTATESTQSNVITPVVPTVKPVLPEVGKFGNGRLSPLMEECFHDLTSIFNMLPAKADKLSRQIGSDYGSAESRGEITKKSVKVGKTNDDGKVTVKQASIAIKGITCTPPLEMLRILKYIDESGTIGIISRKTQWVLAEGLVNYIAGL